jgi:hypothetical protein
MEKDKIVTVKELLPQFVEHLEEEATLVTEAIGDIIYIANNNSYEVAMELIKKQFVVIDLQDVDNNNDGITLSI